MKHLTKTRVCAVTVAADDGHRGIVAYFSDAELARVHSRSLREARVVPHDLWKDEDGNFYDFSPRHVTVDEEIHRQSGLAKLTREEKRALGL